ncbi:MAG: DbpA RNA binding domain-containing protein, partial [Chthoniobacterales bacterium]|nr:DbpA RNA binding domain-containing protein [Chthoniobacterales bacterium]
PSEETPPPSETQRSQPSNHDQSVQKTTPLRKSNTRKPWRERLTEKRATRASRQRIPPQQQPALPLEQDESPSQRTAPDTPSPPSQSSETTSYDSSLSNSHQDEPPPTSSLQSHENPAPISSTEAPFADSQILSHTEKSSTEPSFPPQPKPEESFEPPSNEDRVAEVLREENVPFPQKLSRSKSQAAIDHARWLRISVGREHGIREHDLQALVEVVCDLPHSAIGEIRIEDSFSLVEIRPAYSSQLSSQPKQITTDAGPILFTPTSPPRKKSLSSRSGSSRPSSRKSSKQ